MKLKSTKNTLKAPAENKFSFSFSLDYEVNVSRKFIREKVSLKISFYIILTYVLLTTLFNQNHLLLALRKPFLFLFTVF